MDRIGRKTVHYVIGLSRPKKDAHGVGLKPFSRLELCNWKSLPHGSSRLDLGMSMLLRRITKHVKDQNWTAVGIDFFIVVVGVFIGIQVANWNDAQGDRHREILILQNIANDIRSDIASYEVAIDGAYGKITVINHILKHTSLSNTANFITHADIDGRMGCLPDWGLVPPATNMNYG